MLKINKGINAGGKNTVISGLTFKNKTSIENKLLENNFVKYLINNKNKYGYYFELNDKNNKILYLTQTGLKLYLKKFYDVNIYKHPDESFIIFKNNEIHIKILEKKNQNVSGSVEDKLKTGKFNKTEYEKMIRKEFDKNNIQNKLKITYAFCVSSFLKNKLNSNSIKYNIIKEILDDDDIKIFYGDDDNYFDILYEWIHKL